MRFGFVVTNLAGGGAEKAVLNIGAGLAERGHRVDLILIEPKTEHPVPPGLTHHVLGATLKGWLGKRLAAWKLRGLLSGLERGERFTLLVSTLPFADEVTLLAGAREHWCRIANTLSAEVARLEPATGVRRMARYRRMYGARPLIAVSQGVAEDLRGACGIPARVETVPNPFDWEAIRRLAKAEASLPKPPYILHAGRFSGQKRHDLLLDAFSRLEAEERLVLLTEKDPRLERMIAERGLGARVQVAGFQQNPYPWIAGARLLVLCSDHEGLPNVLIEAIALGVPVVSTDCPSGPREILGAALPGQLVPRGDATALAEAMARTLAAPPDVSRVDLQRYAKDRVLAAYERLGAEGRR